MRKNKLFVILFILVLVIVGNSTFSVFAAQGGREGAAALAESQVGQTDGTKYGAPSGAAWCAYFAGWCARNGGGIGTEDWPNSGSTTILVDKFQKMGRWHDKCNTSWSYYKSGYGTISGGGKYDSYTPQPGDFVAIDNNGSVGDGPDHTGIVYSVVGSTLTTIEGNISKKVVKVTYNLSTLRPTSGNVSSSTVIVGFGEPNYKTTNQSPRLTIDSAQANGDGTITIRGWAFDPDNPSASVTIHTYIGGDVGTPGVEGWQYVADQESSDVNIAYGISGNHRFNATIKTAKRGSQGIVVYALDTNQGTNAAYGPISVVITNTNDIDIVSSTSVDEGKSRSISFTFHGDGIHQMAYGIHDESIISATWTDFNWDETKGTITVNGLKEGKTILDICFLDDNGKEFYKEPVTITVNHVHKYTIEKVTKEATCSSTGLKKYYCSCGAVSSQTTTIAKKSHTYVTDAAVAATCTQAGKTAGKHCSVCGYVLTAQTTIPAKGHSYVTDAAVTATCTQAGKTEGKHCSTCGYVLTAQTTIPAKGHSYVTDAAVAATCTQAGKTEGKHCSTCGYVLTVQTTIPAQGHSYITDAAVAATCTQSGKTEGKHCAVCGYAWVKQENIAAKGHSYVTDVAVAATCTQAGKTEGKHCSACGYVDVAQISIPKLSHSYNNGICIRCGNYTGNESGNTDTNENAGREDNTSTEENDSTTNSDNKQDGQINDENNDAHINFGNNGKYVCFEARNLKFRVIDAEKKQVMILGCLNKKSKKINIPAMITNKGTTYSVVAVGSNAFMNMKKLEKVTVGKNVVSIGGKAFYNCSRVKSIQIKSKQIKQVDKNAFGRMNIKCKLYVERKMMKKYKKLFYKSGLDRMIKIL